MYRLLKNIYGIDRTDMILRVSDNAYIPNDSGNCDWQVYQEWLALGNIPEASI